jgi:hypothetical protein
MLGFGIFFFWNFILLQYHYRLALTEVEILALRKPKSGIGMLRSSQ